MRTVDLEATQRTRSRYQRVALLHDGMEGIAERRYAPWRTRLWSLVRGRPPRSGGGHGQELASLPVRLSGHGH